VVHKSLIRKASAVIPAIAFEQHQHNIFYENIKQKYAD